MNADLRLLQGGWRQVAFEENGVSDAPDAHGALGAVTAVAGEAFQVAVRGEEALIEGSFTLDGSAWPRPIDWMVCGIVDVSRQFVVFWEMLRKYRVHDRVEWSVG